MAAAIMEKIKPLLEKIPCLKGDGKKKPKAKAPEGEEWVISPEIMKLLTIFTLILTDMEICLTSAFSRARAGLAGRCAPKCSRGEACSAPLP